eukprot:362670-Chlamydomonas_euryale.AAC.4
MYRTIVLPIFLYGCKTWTWAEVQMGRLESGVANVVQPFLVCNPVARQKIWKLLRPEKPV